MCENKFFPNHSSLPFFYSLALPASLLPRRFQNHFSRRTWKLDNNVTSNWRIFVRITFENYYPASWVWSHLSEFSSEIARNLSRYVRTFHLSLSRSINEHIWIADTRSKNARCTAYCWKIFRIILKACMARTNGKKYGEKPPLNSLVSVHIKYIRNHWFLGWPKALWRYSFENLIAHSYFTHS